jgi:hypothetical protein
MVPLNCPLCGRAMVPRRSMNDWHFYQCWTCGPITLPPDGLMRPTKATDDAVSRTGNAEREVYRTPKRNT